MLKFTYSVYTSIHVPFTDDAEHGGEGSSSRDPASDPAGGKEQAEGT